MGAAFIGLALHLVCNLFLGVINPAISATYGIFASLVFGVAGLLLTRDEGRVHGPT
jgi:SSS family solute:Na+ symporter/sodium/pantothenate symporter